eukprot:bmy_04235T0
MWSLMPHVQLRSDGRTGVPALVRGRRPGTREHSSRGIENFPPPLCARSCSGPARSPCTQMTPECVMDAISFGAVGPFTTKPCGCEVPASPALARPQALWSGERVVTADPSGYHLPVTSPPQTGSLGGVTAANLGCLRFSHLGFVKDGGLIPARARLRTVVPRFFTHVMTLRSLVRWKDGSGFREEP